MNVAITRARCSLYILGNAPTLERSNDTWKQIVEDARARGCLQDVKCPHPECDAHFIYPLGQPAVFPNPNRSFTEVCCKAYAYFS